MCAISRDGRVGRIAAHHDRRSSLNIIRSRFHNIFTETVNKIAISADDDKRVVMEDKISTLAIGHYRAERYDIANMIRLNMIKDD